LGKEKTRRGGEKDPGSARRPSVSEGNFTKT